MIIEVAGGRTDWRSAYKQLIGIVTPRPVALVSTISKEGCANLAPFSFFNLVSANPPVLVVCPSIKRGGEEKDTLRNIRETGEFVVASATEAIAERMNACSAELPHGQSEFAYSGLTPAPATRVRAALVRESPVNMECVLREIVTISREPGGGSVIFGEISVLHIEDGILDAAGGVDPRKLRTVGRMGGLTYCRTTDVFDLPRPKF